MGWPPEFLSGGRCGEVADLRASAGDVGATRAAMARGAGVIFQAPLSMPLSSGGDGGGSAASGGGARGFRGVADFLVRVDRDNPPSETSAAGLNPNSAPRKAAAHGGGPGGGPGSGATAGRAWDYEVWDAKLSKRASPAHVLQVR